MMAKLARLTGQEVIAALKRDGFEVLRIKGSHHFVGHSDGRRTVSCPGSSRRNIGSWLDVENPAGLRNGTRRIYEVGQVVRLRSALLRFFLLGGRVGHGA